MTLMTDPFIVPPRQVHPVKQLEIRNEEYLVVFTKINAFFDSIIRRISAFDYQFVSADKVEEAQSSMEEWADKSEADRRSSLRLLRKTYEQASPSNGTEMTSIRRALQDKAVEWDLAFTAFEKKVFPSDKDVRRVTAQQLKKLFTDSNSTSTSRASSPDRRHALPLAVTATEADPVEQPSTASALDGDNAATAPGHSSSSRMESTSDGESDSTVCADPLALTPAFPPGSLGPSDSELDNNPDTDIIAGLQTPGRGVANLVNFFSHDPPTSSPPVSVPSRYLRARPARRSDAFSDGGVSGYAANVGVSHLALAVRGGVRSGRSSPSGSRASIRAKTRLPVASTSTLTPAAKPSNPRRPARTSPSQVLILAQHFNDKARESAQQHRTSRARGGGVTGRRARPVVDAAAQIQVFDNLRDAVQEDSDSDPAGSSDGGADDEQDFAELQQRSRSKTRPALPLPGLLLSPRSRLRYCPFPKLRIQ